MMLMCVRMCCFGNHFMNHTHNRAIVIAAPQIEPPRETDKKWKKKRVARERAKRVRADAVLSYLGISLAGTRTRASPFQLASKTTRAG